MSGFDAKSIIAVLVIVGCFALLGVFVVEGKVPDATIAAIIAGALSGVVNYFFGHLNGTLSGQLAAATQLAQAAMAQLPPPPQTPPPVRVTATVEPAAPSTGAPAAA